MNSCGRKGWGTDGDVFGAARLGSAIPDPLTRGGHDRLSGVYVGHATFVFNAKHAAKNDRNFFKLGTLTRFLPSLRRHHPGHAHAAMSGIDVTCKFLDSFGFVSSSGNHGRTGNQFRHRSTL